MRDATLYYAHIVKLATNPEYKKDEYLKKLVGFVNNLKHVERTKVTNIDQIKTLKKGALLSQPYGQTSTRLERLYIYLTSEAEREVGRSERAHRQGAGGGLIKIRDLDQDFFIYKGINSKSKSVVLERMVVRGGSYVTETVEKPMVIFEKQLKRGNIKTIDPAAYGGRFSKETDMLVKLIVGIFETLREGGGIPQDHVESYFDESGPTEDLRNRIYRIRYDLEQGWDHRVSTEDMDLHKRYQDRSLPYSAPSDEQQELRQILRRFRVEEEEAPESAPPERGGAPSERGGIWDLVRPSARARPQPDEERHIQSRESPRLAPISGASGPLPYEMGYELAEEEGEEESLKTMKRQRKFAKDGVITISKSYGGPWSGTVEEFERFWKLGASRASERLTGVQYV